MTRLFRAVALSAMFLAAAWSTPLAAQGGATLVVQAEKELEAAQGILKQVTNDADRAVWEQRVGFAQQELDNARMLEKLESQEKGVVRKQRNSAEFALREMLGTVDTQTSDAEREVRNMRTKIRGLKTDRAELERLNARKTTAEETEEEEKERVKREVKIANLDAEILAFAYQRDAADLQLRVAGEAERIEAFCKTNALNPRPTIRLMVQKCQCIEDAQKNRVEYRSLRLAAETQLKDTKTVKELLENKFKSIDREIALLKDSYKSARKLRPAESERATVENTVRHLRQLQDRTDNEKDYLEDRIKYVQAQVTSLERTIVLATQAEELLESNVNYLVQDRRALMWRYFGQILGPVVLIILLTVAYYLLRTLVFPLFFKKDSLFVARRLGQYILVMLIIIIIVSFFLEDLRGIATILGIVGAAIVIALQDLCASFAGWFVIVASGKIKVGDRVEINGEKGDIIDIQLLRTTMVEVRKWLDVDEPTGRIVVIPNSFIFKDAFHNASYIHKFLWDKIDITVTYETPMHDAYQLLLRILMEENAAERDGVTRGEERIEKVYGSKHAILQPRVDTIIADCGVCFRLFFTAECTNVDAVKSKIMQRILDAFARDTRLQFAYPTRRQIGNTAPLPPVLPDTMAWDGKPLG